MNAIGIGPMPVASHEVKSRSMIPPGVSRRVSEIPLRMLSVASVAMIDGIFKPADQAGVDQSEDQAAEEDGTDPEQDLGGGGVGADHERGDHHPEGDHRTDRQVEIADEQRVGLAHRHQRERHGEQEDAR